MYTIIINPVSGGGASMKKLPAIKNLLEKRGIEYRVEYTENKGDAQLIAARAAADGLDGIIAVGGDGTFSETVNGIAESGILLLFAPCGTGNDFMRMFDMPKDTLKALEKQLDSPVRMIDIGRCNERYCLNVTGCGFDVDVLAEVEKLRGKSSGLVAYMRGAYSAIKNYRPMNVKLSVDGSELTEKRATIISVGNGSFIGGGMHAIPGSSVDDGSFDMMMAGPVNKLSIYVLLILFALGKHLKIKSIVTKLRCKTVRITGKDLMFEADGEVFNCNDATLTIIPGALRTRLPK